MKILQNIFGAFLLLCHYLNGMSAQYIYTVYPRSVAPPMPSYHQQFQSAQPLRTSYGVPLQQQQLQQQQQQQLQLQLQQQQPQQQQYGRAQRSSYGSGYGWNGQQQQYGRAQRSSYDGGYGWNGQQQQYGRVQRSLYDSGYGWSGLGVGHITRDELIALLQAWKEVESAPAPEEAEPEPEKEPEEEPEPEPEEEEKVKPEPEPEEEKENEEKPESQPEGQGPPPGVPLTVSLPAFVPIQLQAMYTAPAPAAAPAAAEPARAPEPDSESEPAPGQQPQQESEALRQAAQPPWLRTMIINRKPPARSAKSRALKSSNLKTVFDKTALKTAYKTFMSTTAKTRPPKFTAMKVNTFKNKNRMLPIKFPVLNPRTFASNYYGAPKPRTFKPAIRSSPLKTRVFSGPPISPFLRSHPGHLQLVPSSQILSNWK